MEEGNVASRLRLSSARRRIDAFVEQIDVLAASSFPHTDSKKALAAIRKHCVGLKADLQLPAGVRDDVVDQVCLRLLDEVAGYTDILGFILRSTNVRNPFELHHVLKKMIGEALDGDVSLLISSEWAYVPFTYPMSVELLPDFVLIGTPAPESGNPLLIPLAGHEIGHSAWRVYECTPEYSDAAAEGVKEELGRNTRAAREIIDNAPLSELDTARVIDRCTSHVMQQLEEAFCDLFGLYLFGHAYIAAFDYLLGPGGFDRALNYPSDAQRMEILREAAIALGMNMDASVEMRWTKAQPMRADRAEAEIADAVTARMIATVRTDLFANLRSKNILPPDAAIVLEVLDAFQRGEPYPERAGLGEIVSAGWQRIRQIDEELDDDRRKKGYRVLGDLVLKTVEVAEYHDRVTGNA